MSIIKKEDITQKRTSKLPLKLAVLFIILCWALDSLLLVLPINPEQLIFRTELHKADIIIVLEGVYISRFAYAFDLAESGYSKKIFAPDELLERNRKYVNGYITENKNIDFISGSPSHSTYEEALQSRNFIRNNKIKSVILVTSTYHSYRAWWIFQKVLPEVRVISQPVPDEKSWYNKQSCVRSRKCMRIFEKERMKFLLYYLAYAWRIY